MRLRTLSTVLLICAVLLPAFLSGGSVSAGPAQTFYLTNDAQTTPPGGRVLSETSPGPGISLSLISGVSYFSAPQTRVYDPGDFVLDLRPSCVVSGSLLTTATLTATDSDGNNSIAIGTTQQALLGVCVAGILVNYQPIRFSSLAPIALNNQRLRLVVQTAATLEAGENAKLTTPTNSVPTPTPTATGPAATATATAVPPLSQIFYPTNDPQVNPPGGNILSETPPPPGTLITILGSQDYFSNPQNRSIGAGNFVLNLQSQCAAGVSAAVTADLSLTDLAGGSVTAIGSQTLPAGVCVLGQTVVPGTLTFPTGALNLTNQRLKLTLSSGGTVIIGGSNLTTPPSVSNAPAPTQTAIAQATQTAQANATQTAQAGATQTARAGATQTAVAALTAQAGATQTAAAGQAAATQTAIAAATATAQAALTPGASTPTPNPGTGPAGVGSFGLYQPLVMKRFTLAGGSVSWGSGFVVANLSATAPANLIILAYLPNGQLAPGFPATGLTDSIEPGKSNSYFSENANDLVFSKLANGDKVSMIVLADQPIASNVNTQKVGTGSDGAVVGAPTYPFRVGTSAGITFDQAAPTVFVPQASAKFGGSNALFNSLIEVQNTDNRETAITIQVFSRDGTKVDELVTTIPSLATYELNLGSRPALTSDQYAVKVSANNGLSRLAVTVITINDDTAASRAQALAFNGASSGSPRLFMPRVVRRYYDYNSGIRVQNMGSVPTDIRFSYVFNGQTSTFTISGVTPGQAVGPFLGDDQTGDKPANLPNQATGSLVVESLNGQPLIGLVNEDNRTLGQGATYNAFLPVEAANGAVIPQVVHKLGNSDLDRLSAWYISGIQYQNVGASAANCTVTFASSGRPDVTINAQLGSFESTSTFLGDVAGLSAAFNGSARIACDQPVVAIGNLSVRLQSNNSQSAGAGDSFTQSNGRRP